MTSGQDAPPAAEPEPPVDPLDARRRRPLLIRGALGLLVGLVVASVVISVTGGFGSAARALADSRPGWVAAAFACGLARLAVLAAQIGRLAQRSGPLSRREAGGLAMVIFGVGAVTPAAPAEGLAFAGLELTARGRDRSTAVITLALVEWFAQRAFYLVSALGLLAVVLVGHLTAAESWPFVVAAVVVLVVLVTTAYAARRPATAVRAAGVLGALRFRGGPVPAETRRERGLAWHADALRIAGGPGDRLILALLSIGAVLLDSATLWAACRATGVELGPELVLLANTVGTMASWVPLLPSGLGVVEAVIPSILHRFGAPLDAAVAATLAARAAGTFLPALLGLPAAAALRRARRAPAVPATAIGAGRA